jgi:DNA-binding PadR family transcriptional regulator
MPEISQIPSKHLDSDSTSRYTMHNIVWKPRYDMNAKTQFLKGCTRTLVLKVLSERPMYGYEIATILANRSDRVFELGQGTLYPLLYSLERKGLIRVSPRAGKKGNGRKRLYYKLTPKGTRALEEDMSTWASIQRGMKLVLGSPTYA